MSASPQTPRFVIASPDAAFVTLTNGALFGPPPRLQSLPKTNLDLSLLGVLLSNDPRQSLALIRVGAAAVAPYAVGDGFSSGVSLRRIGRDEVVIEAQGQLQRLSLSQPEYRPVE